MKKMFLQNLLIKYCSILLLTVLAGNAESMMKPPVNYSDSLLPKKISVAVLPDPIVSSDSASCTIPFSRAGNLILIKAKADSIEGNFILDTGAPHLVLNITYFRDYPSTIITDDEQGSITGSTQGVIRTTVNKLSFGPVKYAKAEADLVNLGNIENSKGIKILGLLGIQLFRQFEMIIDYEKSVIHLHLINKKEANTYRSELLSDTSTYNILPITIIENKIIANTELAGKKLRLLIDCGAETNVIDSRLPNKILENVVISRRIILNGSGNQKVEALYGDIKNLTIGNENIATLPVIVANLEKTCLSYISCIDGILGFDFLSLHKIGFNFVKRKMYIWK
jgi:hypothetical protein